MDKVILAYVSQYKEKYFFNEELGTLPEAVKKEILMNMIFICEEAGGVVELGFDEEGYIYLDTYADEDDLGYDQVSGRLLVSEMERNQKELFEELQNWYRIVARPEEGGKMGSFGDL